MEELWEKPPTDLGFPEASKTPGRVLSCVQSCLGRGQLPGDAPVLPLPLGLLQGRSGCYSRTVLSLTCGGQGAVL